VYLAMALACRGGFALLYRLAFGRR
jgi:hypothetical protein